MRKQILAVALVATLVLAGCSGAVQPGSSTSDATSSEAAQSMASGTGTINFYVSDEQNAIADFQSLNVTVDAVSFKYAGTDEQETQEDSETEETAEQETQEDSETEETAEQETQESTETETADEAAEATETAETETTATVESADTANVSGSESESGSSDSGADSEEDSSWVVHDVNSTTMDLTELQGDNATLLSQMELQNGTYTQVRIHITEVNGTLTDGTQVNVKLPSNKLKLNSAFTIGDGEEVDFVYDATVFKAGKSGKYILKPVASESGTDVPINSIDKEQESEGDIEARFVGQVEPGQATTVKVTQQGEDVSGATVMISETEYVTGSDGTVMFDVPSESEELEVEIQYNGSEAELELSFGDESEPNAPGDNGSENGQARGSVEPAGLITGS
jgi:hypothetical protein